MIPQLSDLRDPPVVGRFYRVPFVHFNWMGVVADWPVLGPMHTDADVLKFTARHYHVDARFVGHTMRRRLRLWSEEPVFALAQRYPVSRRIGSDTELPVGRPATKALRCVSSEFPYYQGHQTTIGELRKVYEPAFAIPRADGRKLCPHRKVDLSQFPADADGMVTCPLHGLRVCVDQVPA
jgi:hypothetical protein